MIYESCYAAKHIPDICRYSSLLGLGEVQMQFFQLNSIITLLMPKSIKNVSGEEEKTETIYGVENTVPLSLECFARVKERTFASS